MQYHAKLKIFKNSTNNNTFDGHKAISYGWYVYAIALSDGQVVMCENTYSSTTRRHMNVFEQMLTGECLYVLAPDGLGKLESAKREINVNILRLEKELQSKRIRNIQERKRRIELLQKQLVTIALIEQDNIFREKKVG